MARKRTRKPKLPKLLDKSPDVVAVVDCDFEVIYANESCCNWLTMTADELVGSVLPYKSTMDSITAARNSGICPDPAYFSADFRSANGQISKRVDGKIWFKAATFTAIRESIDQPNQILIIGTGADFQELNPDDRLNLHAQLQLIVEDFRQKNLDHYSIDNLIGQSEFAVQLKRKMEAVAGNDSDCLIVGPTGSGKEHIARTIFAKRNRPSTNLVPVHCAIADGEVIQESIKEWALGQRERKSTDWLLLLDVDQMQPTAQVELFGYTQIPGFKLRILATAEKPLMEQPEFHRGLAMQLSIQVLELVPLNQRQNDLGLIVQHMVESLNGVKGKNISRVADEVLEKFLEYSWPRNLDELKEYVADAYQNCNGSIVNDRDLPDSFNQSLLAERIGYHEFEKIELDQFLADIEKQLIVRALTQARNNKTKAAELLGINRAKLLRRSAALDIIKKESASEVEQIDPEMFKEADQ